MFPDIGGAEYLIIGIVVLLVVKPKDLPIVMRKMGDFVGKARRMASDFRASFEDMARQSELDDLRKEVEAMRAKVADPMGVNTLLQETTSEISASVESYGDPYADSSFSHDYPHDAPFSEGPIVQDKPKARKRKAAPTKTAAAKPKTAKTPAKKRGDLNMALDEDDDHIEKSRAPLLEHLKELRTRLTISISVLVIGFVFCFIFSKPLLAFLLEPFEKARSLVALTAKHGSNPFNADMLLGLLGLKTLPPGTGQEFEPIATALLETFMTEVKVAAFGAIVITFPVLAWQLYRFIAPGLYKRERKAFLPFLLAAPVLFVMGAALVYYVMLPFLMWFGFQQQDLGPIKVHLMPKVGDYLPLVIKLVLAFGLCFQLPVVLTLVALAGIVDSKALASFRRYAIVAIVVVAAVVTPPDPISQLALAFPLILLYEVSIWCVKIIELRRKRDDAAAEAT